MAPAAEPGTVVGIPDATAPFAGHLPERDDITCFVTHPCQPPIFNDESTPEGRADNFGGVAAQQGGVDALMQGRANIPNRATGSPTPPLHQSRAAMR